MSWFIGILELVKFLGMILNWFYDGDKEVSKKKRDTITQAMEAADQDDQDGVRRAINQFNSI